MKQAFSEIEARYELVFYAESVAYFAQSLVVVAIQVVDISFYRLFGRLESSDFMRFVFIPFSRHQAATFLKTPLTIKIICLARES